jgi:hypothetical protein
MMDIPEHALALIVKSASSQEARYIAAGQPEAMEPLLYYLTVRPYGIYVAQRYTDLALESPDLVHALYIQMQDIVFYFMLYHGVSIAYVKMKSLAPSGENACGQ